MHVMCVRIHIHECVLCFVLVDVDVAPYHFIAILPTRYEYLGSVLSKSGALFSRGWQLDLRKSSQWYAEYPAMLAKWKHAVW